jgi:hypothetical protein
MPVSAAPERAGGVAPPCRREPGASSRLANPRRDSTRGHVQLAIPRALGAGTLLGFRIAG